MVSINNLTSYQINEDLLKQVVEEVLKTEHQKGEISLAFIGPARMRKLNRMYRKKNRVTDVLSFPEREVKFKEFAIEGIEKSPSLGEIVICLREVKKSAKRANIPFEQQLLRVLIHGVLHLIGYDHEKSKEEAEKMREKQENYLKRFLK